MAKNTKYLVTGGDHVSRFSSYQDAIWFARECSRMDSPLAVPGFMTEVRMPDGLIAQFSDGKATPEFAHLDA